MIRFVNVTKYYPTTKGRKYILKNVNLELPMGKNIGVFGLNGAGKSTFIRLIGGIDVPNQGYIETNLSVSWAMGVGTGLQGSLTGRENAQFVCSIYFSNKQLIRRKIAFIKEFAEIDDYFDMPVKTYSSGMRSKLTFAMSMAFDFDYYLLDEIGAVGDARFREKSKRAFEERKGKANYIMVSHNVKHMAQECDVGLVIGNGNIELYDDVNDALRMYEESVRSNLKNEVGIKKTVINAPLGPVRKAHLAMIAKGMPPDGIYRLCEMNGITEEQLVSWQDTLMQAAPELLGKTIEGK